jgi:hypothetical protein
MIILQCYIFRPPGCLDLYDISYSTVLSLESLHAFSRVTHIPRIMRLYNIGNYLSG